MLSRAKNGGVFGIDGSNGAIAGLSNYQIQDGG